MRIEVALHFCKAAAYDTINIYIGIKLFRREVYELYYSAFAARLLRRMGKR